LLPVAGRALFLALHHREDPEEIAKRSLELAGAAKQAGNSLVRCIADDEPNLDLWSKSDESLRTIIAKHYDGLPERMRARCIPALEKVRGSLTKSANVPERVGTALEAYKDALRSAAASGEAFAQKTAARDEEMRGFGEIAKAAIDWGTAPLPTDPAPFERFFVCAVPGLPQLDDSDKLFKHFTTNLTAPTVHATDVAPLLVEEARPIDRTTDHDERLRRSRSTVFGDHVPPVSAITMSVFGDHDRA
jgi:hypothetical protein